MIPEKVVDVASSGSNPPVAEISFLYPAFFSRKWVVFFRADGFLPSMADINRLLIVRARNP